MHFGDNYIPYDYVNDVEVTDLPFGWHHPHVVNVFKREPDSYLNHYFLKRAERLPRGQTCTKWLVLTIYDEKTIDNEQVDIHHSEGKLYDYLYAIEGLLVKCCIGRDMETNDYVAFPAEDFTPRMIKMLRWSGHERSNYVIHFEMDDPTKKPVVKKKPGSELISNLALFKPLLKKIDVVLLDDEKTWLNKKKQWKEKAVQELNEYIPKDVAEKVVDIACSV
jgi:hypothetical protein